MKLQQLRFLAAVAQNDLNLTAAAARLGATQPAISKQLKLLEDELGFDIFVRKGRAIIRMTQAGDRVVARAVRMLREVHGITSLSADVKDAETGTVSIGTTHTQARYVLPEVIRAFRAKHPTVNLHLHQGTSEQIAQMAALDRIDLAIDTGPGTVLEGYNVLPCHRSQLCIVVPQGHPLTQVERLCLGDLAHYPLVTYEFGASESPGSVRGVFATGGVQPKVSLTAWDSDVIKTYVRLGMGVGLLSEVAVEPDADADLAYVDASHLFPGNTTWVGFARGAVMRRFVYDFLSLLAPHLTQSLVDQAAACATQKDVDRLFEGIQLESWHPLAHSGAPHSEKDRLLMSA
jgi:LysR family cys regulon transcriptional activator